MKRTLAGRTILVTRPAEQAASLVRELERRGARVLVAPTIRLVPARSAALTAALKELAAGRFEWITLTSAATVDVLRDRLSSPADVHAKVAAIGDGTAAAFRRWSRRDPDLQPETFTTAALARAFPRGSGPCPHRPCRHRPAGAGGRDRTEGMGARPRGRVPDGVRPIAPAGGAP